MDLEGFPVDYFLAKVEERDGHCIWTGALGGNGKYGVFTWVKDGQRVTKPAHVWSHLLFIGPIPEGYEVDHACRIHTCVKPACLEAVTQDENNRRKRQKFCKNNHELTEENVYRNRYGVIHGCKKCRREAFLRWKGKSKEVRPNVS